MTTGLEFEIGGDNTAAAAFAEAYAADMVQVAAETRAAIKAAITRSFREGWNGSHDAARVIRSMIGMTTQQAQGALNYRQTLLDSGLKPAQVEKRLDRYIERKVADRAETIARTETMRALNAGAMADTRSAVADGTLSANAKKAWSAAPDERTCPQCDNLDGQEVALDEDFSGGFDAPPAHPTCRCSIAIIANP